MKEEFERRAFVDYSDEFDIIGSVAMARVNKPKISILLQDGREVEAPFDETFQDIIFDSLRSKLLVRVQGVAVFSAEGEMERIVQMQDLSLNECLPEVKPLAIPLWKRLEKIAQNVPEEAKGAISADAVINVDNHLYGAL